MLARALAATVGGARWKELGAGALGRQSAYVGRRGHESAGGAAERFSGVDVMMSISPTIPNVRRCRGEHGRGTAEHFGLLGDIDIITSTLGKALGGAAGGFVAASA